MPLPWEEVKALPATAVAEALGLVKPPRVVERHKWSCPVCGSYDGLHLYPNSFRCYSGCDKRFSTIDMTMAVLGLDATDALRYLAERFNIPIPEWEGRDPLNPVAIAPAAPPAPRLSAQEQNLQALQNLPDPRYPPVVYRDFWSRLSLTASAAGYLDERKIDSAAAAAYGFRSIDTRDQWDELSFYLASTYRPEELKAAGFPLYTAEELEERKMPPGLKKARMPWGGIKPMLVLPYWFKGDLVGVRVRNLEPNPRRDPESGKLLEPKYLTPREANPPYPFNADALGGRYLHLIEGELNAYCLFMAPYREAAVGLAGAGMWRPEWTDLIAGVRRLIAWYDDDQAGRRGYERLRETLAATHGQEWVQQRVYGMIQDKDPNDLHRERRLRKIIAERPWRV